VSSVCRTVATRGRIVFFIDANCFCMVSHRARRKATGMPYAFDPIFTGSSSGWGAAYKSGPQALCSWGFWFSELAAWHWKQLTWKPISRSCGLKVSCSFLCLFILPSSQLFRLQFFTFQGVVTSWFKHCSPFNLCRIEFISTRVSITLPFKTCSVQR